MRNDDLARVDSPSCRLTFLDVGQGDAIVIQTPDHQDVVIDGGPSAEVSRQLGPYMGFGNDDVEMLIVTHPDADHLTGALAILKEWKVKTVLTTGVVGTTNLWERWQAALSNHEGVITGVRNGQQYVLGKYLTIDVVWPDRSWAGVPYSAKATDGEGSINDTSLGTKITCAGSTALMLGDASVAVEKKLVASNIDLRVGLLKPSHHGSKFSSSREFLQAVHPAMAAFSVGAKNRYGHPHPTVVQRIETLHISAYRTDKGGTLQFKSVAGGWENTP